MQTLIQKLLELSSMKLHSAAVKWGLQLGRVRWRVMACLLAVEKSRLYQAHGCSSAVQYAVRYLEMEGHVAAEMLRVARVLENLPAISSAFAEGTLSWSKIRELTRVAKTETDRQWCDFALEHTASEVELAVVRSPRQWTSDEALRSQRYEQPEMGSIEMVEVIAASGLTLDAETYGARQTATSVLAHSEPALPDTAPSGELPAWWNSYKQEMRDERAEQRRAQAPEPPRFIKVELRLTPEQYHLLQAAETTVRRAKGARVKREQVIEEVCR
jgi:hypothetical protein